MENRKGYKKYLINGFASGKNSGNRWFNMPCVQTGFHLALAGLMFAFAWIIGLGEAAMVTLGFAPMIKFNKDGLSGDNLKLVEDLEKRMALVPDELKEQILKGMVEKQLEERLASFKGLGEKEIKEILKLAGEGDDGVRSILKKQGEELVKLQEKLAAEKTKQDEFSVRAQIEKWRAENADSIKRVKEGAKNVSLTPLEVRVVASPMTPANSLTSTVSQYNAFITSLEIAPGVVDLIRVRPTFWDYIKKGATSAVNYAWVNKKNPQGAAGFIAPGVAKPGISFELASELSAAKKIAESMKIATELLEDVPGMTTLINQELAYALKSKINTTLIGSQAATSTLPEGLQHMSVAYTLAGVQTANANNWDAIHAVVAQLTAGNFPGRPTVFVNPVDYANMKLTKAISEGQLFAPTPPDADIVVDNNIPVGYFQAVLLDLYRILIYKDYTVTFGWENDDFTKNLVTVIGEVRLHQFYSANHAGFAVYDTFDNVKAAITTV